MSRLPFPEKVLGSHIATLGKTGSGKSSAMRVIAEHLLDKNRRVAIVDPKGDWWGLKSSADGKSAGYPVIAFGSFKEPRATDVPLNESSGKYVAELIASGNRPCIVGFRGWMPAQMMRFWIGTKDAPGFAQTLFNANEGELYVLIDEVHNFAPKGKVLDPDSGKSLHWTNRIMSEGRGLGMTFLIASQRPQKVHNDTLENCETLLAMRVTHPRSREATEEWINAKGDPALAKQVMSTLAELNRGEAWVWSPENGVGPKRVQFPMFETFDSFAPPQLQKKVSQAGWSEVDLDQVKQKLATVIAEAKANDPKELKAEISRLRQELAKKPTPAAVFTAADRKIAAQAGKASMTVLTRQQKLIEQMRAELEAAMKVIARVTVFGFEQTKINPKQLEQAIQKAVEEIGRSIATTSDVRRREFDQLKSQASDLLKRLERVIDKKLDISVDVVRAQPPFVLGPSTTSRPAAPASHARNPKPFPLPSPVVSNSSPFGQVEQNILDQLAELDALGIARPTKAQLSLMCGYSNPRSGGFSEPIAKLLQAGFISYPSQGLVALTDEGRAIAQSVSRPMSLEELHQRLYRKLGGAEEKILREIIAAYPDALQKDELASKCGYSNPRSGGFSEPIGRLRELGIVDYPLPGQVRSADWLHLESAESVRA